MIRLLLILTSFVFLVFKPLKANLMAFTAKFQVSNLQDRIILLNEAATMDDCNPNIINDLAEAYVLTKNYTMAAITYGNGLTCSPGDSLSRFKYGEALLMMNWIEGADNIREALTLEPHNPIYLSEMNRLKALR